MKIPKSHTMETDRCRLRIVSEDDIPHVFSASRYPGFTDGMLWDPPETEEELREPCIRSIRAWEAGRAYSFTIEDKASGEFLGRISLRREVGEQVWSIGFWTHPRRQNEGFMSEAARKIISFGFSSVGALRIEACHALWNVASRRVLEKAGMVFVGCEKEGFLKNGRWVEENRFAITRPEGENPGAGRGS